MTHETDSLDLMRLEQAMRAAMTDCSPVGEAWIHQHFTWKKQLWHHIVKHTGLNSKHHLSKVRLAVLFDLDANTIKGYTEADLIRADKLAREECAKTGEKDYHKIKQLLVQKLPLVKAERQLQKAD